MKQKILIGVTICLSTVLLTGCSLSGNKEKLGDELDQSNRSTSSEWQKVGEAVSAGKPVACVMENSEAGELMRSWVHNGKVRFETTSSSAPERDGIFVSDGQFGYSWSNESQRGIKFSINVDRDSENDSSPVAEAPDFSQESEWETYQDSGYAVNCDVLSEVDEDMFTPPSDVEFMDMTSFSQQFQQSADQQSASDSSSQEAPVEISEDELRQIMQQFGHEEE